MSGKKVWEPPDCFIPIYSYCLDNKKKLKPEPSEALVVKAIFQMATYGLTEDEIAHILDILRINFGFVEACNRQDLEKCECHSSCRRTEMKTEVSPSP